MGPSGQHQASLPGLGDNMPHGQHTSAGMGAQGHHSGEPTASSLLSGLRQAQWQSQQQPASRPTQGAGTGPSTGGSNDLVTISLPAGTGSLLLSLLGAAAGQQGPQQPQSQSHQSPPHHSFLQQNMPLQLQVQQAPPYGPPPPPTAPPAPTNPGADALYSALQQLVAGGNVSQLGALQQHMMAGSELSLQQQHHHHQQEGYPDGVPPLKRRALQ
jgi:hypothetical protein